MGHSQSHIALAKNDGYSDAPLSPPLMCSLKTGGPPFRRVDCAPLQVRRGMRSGLGSTEPSLLQGSRAAIEPQRQDE